MSHENAVDGLLPILEWQLPQPVLPPFRYFVQTDVHVGAALPLLPLDPEEPLLPLDPEEPLLPLDPDEPLLPLDPDEPLLPLDPDEPLLPLDPDEPLSVLPDEPLLPLSWFGLPTVPPLS